MGQLDQNIPDGNFFEDERRYQARRVELLDGRASEQVDISALRREDQNASLERLAVIKSRLRS